MPITLDECFGRMRAAAICDPYPSHERRERWLAALDQVLRDHAGDFCTAIASDFGGRSSHETRLLEVLPSLEAIRFARQHLQDWMAPAPRKTSRWFLPGSARVHYEP